MTTWRPERTLFDAFGVLDTQHYGDSPSMGYFATELAALGRPVFPLLGKVPLIRSPHNAAERGCRGRADGCPFEGHGVYDATTDQDKIDDWWTTWPDANIGVALPPGVIVLDVDPRSGGDDAARALTDDWGDMATATLTSESGRGDGGRHYYFKHDRKIIGKLGKGLDLKRPGGYVVAPPSLHPDTKRPYRWVSHVRTRALPAPQWLQHLLDGQNATQETTKTDRGPLVSNAGRVTFRTQDSLADAYSEATHWADILEPCGWSIVAGDGDSDGSKWRHPTATAQWSATIKHHTLFVYSTNTVFDVTDPGAPRGITPFRAFATLFHRGDQSAAARSLKDQR